MKNHITTDDFYLASYLAANDISLIGHVRENDRSTFEFIGSDLNKLVDRYYHDDIKISPLAFAKAIRYLKNVMYSSTTIYNKPSFNNAIRTSRKDDQCLHS